MATTKTASIETPNVCASMHVTDTTPTVPLPDMPQGLMVLGPQVTFHFVTDKWSSDNSYDYYDVVLVDGASYVAVQDVPAGTELTDADYWFKWAEANAQIELMQQTVSKLNSIIETMQNQQTMLLPHIADVNSIESVQQAITASGTDNTFVFMNDVTTAQSLYMPAQGYIFINSLNYTGNYHAIYIQNGNGLRLTVNRLTAPNGSGIGFYNNESSFNNIVYAKVDGSVISAKNAGIDFNVLNYKSDFSGIYTCEFDFAVVSASNGTAIDMTVSNDYSIGHIIISNCILVGKTGIKCDQSAANGRYTGLIFDNLNCEGCGTALNMSITNQNGLEYLRAFLRVQELQEKDNPIILNINSEYCNNCKLELDYMPIAKIMGTSTGGKRSFLITGLVDNAVNNLELKAYWGLHPMLDDIGWIINAITTDYTWNKGDNVLTMVSTKTNGLNITVPEWINANQSFIINITNEVTSLNIDGKSFDGIISNARTIYGSNRLSIIVNYLSQNKLFNIVPQWFI